MRPGDEAVMAENTFSMYRIVVEAFGGTPVYVPLKDHRLDLAAMAKAVTERTRLIFLAIPNSPTGTIVSREEFERFYQSLPEEGVLLVVDEAYGEYVGVSDCPVGLDYIASGVPVLVTCELFVKSLRPCGAKSGIRICPGMDH